MGIVSRILDMIILVMPMAIMNIVIAINWRDMFALPTHLHPMIVHFPIALFMVALVFEIVGLILKNEDIHKAALYMYITAALITPLVVRTGVWEAAKLGLSHPILDKHSQYATWLMWVSLMSLPVLWFLKKELLK